MDAGAGTNAQARQDAQAAPPQQPMTAGFSAVDAYVLREFARDLRIAAGKEPANDQTPASSETKLAEPEAAE
jgi:hypothetical protein